MHWTARNRDGELVEGTVPTVGFTEGQFRRWLEGQGYTDIEIVGARAHRRALDAAAEQDDATGDNRPARRPPAGAPPAGTQGCAARCLTFSGNHPFDASPVTAEERDEWELCDKPQNDPVHDTTLDDLAGALDGVTFGSTPASAAAAMNTPTRRRPVTPPGADRPAPPDPHADLTDEQRKLYDEIEARAGFDGSDARDVLDRHAASPEDKAAVADAMGGPGAGDHFRERDERIIDRKRQREAAKAAYEADGDYGAYLDRMKDLSDGDRAENTQDVQDRVRKAYDDLADRPGAVVSLADLRNELDDVPREVLDHALDQIGTHPDAILDRHVRLGGHSKEESDAAIVFGGERNLAIRIGGEDRGIDDLVQHVQQRDRDSADAAMHAVPDETLPAVADRMGVDHSDDPPADVLRTRIADQSAANRDAWLADANATATDGTTLYNAENDLDDIRHWDDDRRDEVRAAAERRTSWDWEPGADRAKRVLGAVREADLADAVEIYRDTVTEYDKPDMSAEGRASINHAAENLAAAYSASFGDDLSPDRHVDQQVAAYRAAKQHLAGLPEGTPADVREQAWTALADAEDTLADLAQLD